MTSHHPQLWIRHEVRSTERRAPVVPHDVRTLVDAGFAVTVEESAQRVFDLDEYAEAGASIAPSNSWSEAPAEAVIVGIKELPDEPSALVHRHVYFAHAFKGQNDAEYTLARFRRGGGRILDVEYLVDEQGKRLVAFGYWAGYVGAALGVLQLAGLLRAPLVPTSRPELDASLEVARLHGADKLLGLVTGARGRSGRGAQRALTVAGLPITRWDRQETRDLHKLALLGHDLLVNCVVTHTPTPPFVVEADLDRERRLRVIADVTCDVTSVHNMLPVNTEVTTWDSPARRLRTSETPHGALDMIAIDNLPSLLPKEASETFSADLTPLLLGLRDPDAPTAPWQAAAGAFDRAMAERFVVG